MSKKVFMIFNDTFDKKQQAFWFVNMFIKEKYRDLEYLLNIDQRIMQNEYGISCCQGDDTWVWIDRYMLSPYTKDMTQVYYKQKELGEL